MKFVSKEELLSYEEMERLIGILTTLGIYKVRITGGEPFVRRDLIPFLERVANIAGITSLNITTNGVLTWKSIKELKEIGIQTLNLSLDSVDTKRFYEITRRDVLKDVLKTMELALENGMQLKINTVVMEGKNTEDILPMANLAQKNPIDVRFIEEMPFNGTGNNHSKLTWDHAKIIRTLTEVYPDMKREAGVPASTSYNYSIPGFMGRVGVIPAYSRTFCGDCNRIRITALGKLKTCLYDNGVLDLKRLVNEEKSDERIRKILVSKFKQRSENGFQAEANRSQDQPVSESMSTIGG